MFIHDLPHHILNDIISTLDSKSIERLALTSQEMQGLKQTYGHNIHFQNKLFRRGRLALNRHMKDNATFARVCVDKQIVGIERVYSGETNGQLFIDTVFELYKSAIEKHGKEHVILECIYQRTTNEYPEHILMITPYYLHFRRDFRAVMIDIRDGVLQINIDNIVHKSCDPYGKHSIARLDLICYLAYMFTFHLHNLKPMAKIELSQGTPILLGFARMPKSLNHLADLMKLEKIQLGISDYSRNGFIESFKQTQGQNNFPKKGRLFNMVRYAHKLKKIMDETSDRRNFDLDWNRHLSAFYYSGDSMPDEDWDSVSESDSES